METREFGRTGLRVPVVGMGTWKTFDVHGAEAEAGCQRVVDAALVHGANLFDSSPMYGEAERVLGGALAGRRDDALVATKVWAGDADEGRAQILRSLGYFGGRVEIYQIHNLVAWREHLPVLEELRDRGTVRVIGATHYQHAAFAELLEVIATGRIGQIQIPYNAVDHGAEHEILPAAEAHGLGVIVMRPLGTGALARRAPPREALTRLERFGVQTWSQALLKWILSDPRVHTVIPATSRVEHMIDNAAAGAPPWFDDETRAYVAHLAREAR
jgi:aryl-alcohol dehydrogenase-like predicted oxidoreductase